MIEVSGRSLSLDQVVGVARDLRKVGLSEAARSRVERARALVEKKATEGGAVYGLNTGFGALKSVRIPSSDLARLQVNLVRSHAAGVGAPLGIDATRALMLLRANVMATGRSGVSLPVLELLLAMLNARVHPIVPSQGSVGASGDLAPLAHLALVMIGEGMAHPVEGAGTAPLPGAEALAAVGLAPVRLGAKEGLCLVNGTQAMGAVGALALYDALRLAKIADITGAASLEGYRGTATAFDRRIHDARPHRGQLASASNLRKLTASSEIARSHADCDRVQDAYSFRCMPQVHGASRDGLALLADTLDIELGSATDNPLVFAEEGEGDELLSGGNFHGQPLALGLDVLAIAVSQLASISERRVAQLVDPVSSRLPAFLVRDPGLSSGFMIAQVTAAALVNENRVLATPSALGTIPTSANQEDHVSMGMTAAIKAARIVENTRAVLAIELLAACQAIDLIGLAPAAGVAAARSALRQVVAELFEDRNLSVDIALASELLKNGRIERAVEDVVGPLL
ncbi:MAG: histidine ammonia-lyase [Deltaproteobacteria bacterium]|nr:histidine ammonia-lyase [Deltaproteobacteria bacterium]